MPWIFIIAAFDIIAGYTPIFMPQGLEASALFPVFARERQQGDLAGPFDGTCHFALMLGACAGLTTWADLAIVCDQAFEKFYVLVVNLLLFV